MGGQLDAGRLAGTEEFGRFAVWLWRRFARRYFAALNAVAMLAAFVGLALPSGVIVAFFLGMSLAKTVVWTAAATGAVAIGLAFAEATPGGEVRTLRAWLVGDRDDPVSAWEAAVTLPSVLARRAIVAVNLVLLAALLPITAVLAKPPWYGLVGLGFGIVSVSTGGSVAGASALSLIIRPVLDTWRDLMPLEVLPPRGLSLGDRYVSGMVGLSVALGLATTAAVRGTAATPHDYVIAAFASVVLGAYFTGLFYLGIHRPTLSTLRGLTSATQRIRRGDLDHGIAVWSDDELGEVAVAFNEMLEGLRQRESLRAAFGSYVDPGLAERLLASGSSVFEGEELEVSVLFADVRGFTAYASEATPSEAVALLNQLFEVVVPVLHEHGGHANHYLGDGLMAIFGAPEPLERHADAAVAAAVQIQRAVRAEFGDRLRLGIGINSGAVIAGTVGGGGHHEFTVIGDTVNVAARVEQLTKQTGDVILITEATRQALSSPRPRSTKRGAFDLKGKALAVTVHAVNPFPRSARSRPQG